MSYFKIILSALALGLQVHASADISTAVQTYFNNDAFLMSQSIDQLFNQLDTRQDRVLNKRDFGGILDLRSTLFKYHPDFNAYFLQDQFAAIDSRDVTPEAFKQFVTKCGQKPLVVNTEIHARAEQVLAKCQSQWSRLPSQRRLRDNVQRFKEMDDVSALMSYSLQECVLALGAQCSEVVACFNQVNVLAGVTNPVLQLLDLIRLTSNDEKVEVKVAQDQMRPCTFWLSALIRSYHQSVGYNVNKMTNGVQVLKNETAEYQSMVGQITDKVKKIFS